MTRMTKTYYRTGFRQKMWPLNKQARAHKMAESIEQHTERSSVKIVLPSGWAENENEIPITPEFTAIKKSYFHRPKLPDNPTWSCNEVVQTLEHILYEWMQTSRIAKKFLLTAHNGQRWGLAPCQRLCGTQLFTSLLKIQEFYRLSETDLD